MNNNTKRLPDAEFTVMKIIWNIEDPINTHRIMECLNKEISWKPQTLLTMLARLCEKGFLSSSRNGKERVYTPLISEDEYFAVETNNFLKRYSGNSIGNLVKTLYSEGELSANDLDELKNWLLERK